MRRLLVATALALPAVGVVILYAAPSQAAPIGTVTFEPATGTDTTAIVMQTSGTCPAAATNLIATVTGAGFPDTGQVALANIAITSVPAVNGGYQLPLAGAMRDLANLQSPPATLSGAYAFTVTCRTAFNPASLGDFTGSLRFTSNTAYESGGTATTGPPPTTTPPPTTEPPTTEPTTEPPTTEPPTTTDNVVVTTPPPAGGASETVGTTIGGGSLANTGGAVLPWLTIATALLAAGTWLVHLGRPGRPGRLDPRYARPYR
jgi:hypothetical protein